MLLEAGIPYNHRLLPGDNLPSLVLSDLGELGPRVREVALDASESVSGSILQCVYFHMRAHHFKDYALLWLRAATRAG